MFPANSFRKSRNRKKQISSESKTAYIRADASINLEAAVPNIASFALLFFAEQFVFSVS